MQHGVRLLLVAALIVALVPAAGLAQVSLSPAAPGTGPFSVQMFIGGTQYTYLSVYPPTTYTDGTAIPDGTAVQVKVYRWVRGGPGWTPVTLPSGEGPWGSGGSGVVGQSFINMVAVTPVDCAPPRVIVLGVTAVVGGVESPIINTANLTFRYAAEPPPEDPTVCVPTLVRYPSPEAALVPDQVPPVNSPPPGAVTAATPVPAGAAEPTPAPPTPTPEPPRAVAPSGPPRIDTVKPLVGAVAGAEAAVTGALRNMTVVIAGENFDPINPAENSVTFDGAPALILSVASNEIRVEVPAGAASGPVQVAVNGQSSNSIDFTVTSRYANAVVVEDVRFGREYLPDLLQAALGAPDHDGPAGVGTPGTNIGIGNGGSLTLDLGEGQEVYDGPGDDLVVYERGGGSDQSLANEVYDVLVSNEPDSGFVSLGSAYGIDRGIGDRFDLGRAAVGSARYVRIVDDGDGTTVNGADIDAVEVISVAPAATEPAARGALDLVFVIDLTDSMSDDIANVKETAVEILDTLAANFPDHRVAILGYRDWGDDPMFEEYAFSDDQATIVANINRLTVSGGGDWPEAVLEALLRAIDCSSLGGWRAGVSKQVVLMGDAPPHDPIEQGPAAGQTSADVEVAAKRADPVVINTIVIRSDTETKAAFAALAAASGGAATLAERAEDVPNAILGTIGEIAGTPAEPTPPTVATAETEKNDSFGSANPIVAGVPVAGAIDPERDSDWYELVVAAQGEVRVSITEADPALDMAFRVWNGNGDVILDWQVASMAGGDVSSYVDVPTGGRYVIEVRDRRDNASSATPYRLTADFTPTVDAGEPNASIGSATPITAGTPAQANILPVRDHDFYSLETPGRAELHVLISNVASDLEMVFRILNADGDQVAGWQAGLRAGSDTEAVVDLPQAGTYYIEVAESRDDKRSTQPYTLTATLTPVVDSGESNDSFGRADSLDVGTPWQGTILPVRDHDWYRMAIPGRSELHVLITNVAPELDIVLRVWNADKQVILDWQAPLRTGGDTEAYVDFGGAGTYYLEVADSRDDQRSPQPYFLETALVLTADAAEQNDSFGQAETIQIGQSVQGTILPVRDHDWYSLFLPSQGQLTVEITGVPSTMEIVFRVWNADKQVILDWQAPLRAGGDATGVAAIAAPGVYYLEVANNRDAGRSPLPYTLLASMGGS